MIRELKRHLRELRTWANGHHRRNDDYGNGFKAGLDAALEAARAIEAGKKYDADTDTWTQPETLNQ